MGVYIVQTNETSVKWPKIYFIIDIKVKMEYARYFCKLFL